MQKATGLPELALPMLLSDHSTLLFKQLCSSYIFRACLTSELRTTPLYLVAKPTKLQHLSLSRSLALSLSPSLTLSFLLALVLWGLWGPWGRPCAQWWAGQQALQSADQATGQATGA